MTINYESDFKIIEGFKDGSSILAAPFKFTYYTRMSRGTYVASYDGTEFVNCHPTDDGRVVVPFDNPQFGLGVLNVKREFFLNDKDFADGICTLVSVESTGIVLDRGATDMDGEVNIELFPFYQRGLDGKSAYDLWLDEGNEGSVADFLGSLKGGQGSRGEDGADAYEVWLQAGNEGSVQDFLDSLKGKDGKDGVDGKDGEKGGKGDPLTYDDLTEEQKKDLASQIQLPYSEFINGGVVNISKTGDIERVYDSLPSGGVALCFIGDSSGNYGFTNETRVNVNSKYCTTSNYFFSNEPRCANVGDIILITKQTYAYLLTVCALRIIPLNDAKIPIEGFSGTDGIMTVWDKQRINKVDGIEAGAQDTRNWLSSVNDTVERNLHRTRYGYGTKLEECIHTGVCAYTPDTIFDIAENWTVFVDCSSDVDSGGYYHFWQTAVCRTGVNTGKIFRRLGWYCKNEGGDIVDLNFLEWQS